MFRSATLKLTAWYMLIVTVICIVFSVVLYNFGTHALERGLTHQSQRYSNEYPIFNNDPILRRPGGELGNGAQEIIQQLVAFDIVVLIASGFGSYALAKRTLQPIQQAHEQQTRFTADVSHELRTPLTAIKMESEVALMDSAASKAVLKEALTSNLEEAGKLETLVNNLLRLTKLEASELRQLFVEVPIHTALKDAVNNLQTNADTRHIVLRTNLPETVAIGDRASLTQLFTILIDNAIKYSKDHTTVEISTEDHDDTVVVTIKDSGIGIEQGELEHIFERFYRADKARSHTGSSSSYGLGLSIAKHISDIHNATITLKSRPGIGTTATVVLPKHQPAE